MGRHATVEGHLGEVQGAVETAGELRDVDVEGELHVEGVEVLVGGVGGHEVQTRADVLAVRVVGDELEGQSIAAGSDTIGTGVVGAIQGAVGDTCRRIGAECRVPGVSRVAVGVAGGGVDPAPVGIEHDLSVLSGAAASLGALLPGEGGVDLSCVRADLLGRDEGKSGEGGEESDGSEHCDECRCVLGR